MLMSVSFTFKICILQQLYFSSRGQYSLIYRLSSQTHINPVPYADMMLTWAVTVFRYITQPSGTCWCHNASHGKKCFQPLCSVWRSTYKFIFCSTSSPTSADMRKISKLLNCCWNYFAFVENQLTVWHHCTLKCYQRSQSAPSANAILITLHKNAFMLKTFQLQMHFLGCELMRLSAN